MDRKVDWKKSIRAKIKNRLSQTESRETQNSDDTYDFS